MSRARWIADITAALADAERLLTILETDGEYFAEAIRLRMHVQTIHSKVQLLNRAIPSGDRIVRAPWPDPDAVRVGGS